MTELENKVERLELTVEYLKKSLDLTDRLLKNTCENILKLVGVINGKIDGFEIGEQFTNEQHNRNTTGVEN